MNNTTVAPAATSDTKSRRGGAGYLHSGTIVDAHYGPFETPKTTSTSSMDLSSPPVARKNPPRKRSVVRGVVLCSKDEKTNHLWIVHWFSIQKAAHVPFNQLKVVRGCDSVLIQAGFRSTTKLQSKLYWRTR